MPRARRVLVVGGGAAGVITAAHLVSEHDGPVEVRVVERGATPGPGLAYDTNESLHLLNNYAGRMSALERQPGHLVAWCRSQGLAVTAESFLPRGLYGRYLASVLDGVAAAPGSRVSRLRGEVVAVEDAGDSYLALLSSGSTLAADAVVLALGNPPPRDLPGIRGRARLLVSDPWAPDLTDRVRRGSRVLLVGSGLTAVDIAVQLADAHHDVEVVAVSRHGLLPRRHSDRPPSGSAPFGVPRTGLAALLGVLRRRGAGLEAAGRDWRELVESVNASASDLWLAMSYVDQQRFLRHLARRWEVARHRMAPPMADIVEGLLLDGRLRVEHPSTVDVGSFDLVVNCTGPAPACSPGWNPLVDHLASRGMLRPDRHRLGVDVTPDGALVDAAGRAARGLYAVGAARRGAEWEVAAVPDLRRQAVRLARTLGATTALSLSRRDVKVG